MKHLDNLDWIVEARLLFSATPQATLIHVSYPLNRLNLPQYLMGDETWSGVGGRSKRDVAAGYSSWPLNIIAYYSFISLLSHLETWFAFTARKLQFFQAYLTCLYSHAWFCLFVKHVGTRVHHFWASVSFGAKNSFALDCRVVFPNRLKDLCCFHNFLVLLCRISTNIYGNSSKSVLCFGRQQYHLCVAVQP